MKPIIDELTDRKDLSSTKKWSLRHPGRAALSTKQWRERNPEKSKENNRKYYFNMKLNDPRKYLLKRCKGRANHKKIECTITEQDIIIPEICPILGIKLEFNYGKHALPNSISLDRIDNSKGYIPGNVRVISYKANTWKREMSLKDAERLVAYMRNKI